MPSPKITIILPAYNAQRTIEKSVRSTLKSMPESSVLLVRDDASTDRTVDILKSIADRRLSLIQGTDNLGVARGLNAMLELVTTPCVARMDADDICLPWRFRVSMHAMKNVDVVFSSSLAMTERFPITTRNVPFPISHALFPLHLLIANSVTHSTMLARTEVLHHVGGYRETIAEDYDLWLRLATAGRRLRRIATPTLRYRYHANQLTADQTWLSRVLNDANLIDSYNGLARAELGAEAFWLRDLMCVWNRRQGDPDRLRRFGELVRQALPSRLEPHRVLVERRLRKFGL